MLGTISVPQQTSACRKNKQKKTRLWLDCIQVHAAAGLEEIMLFGQEIVLTRNRNLILRRRNRKKAHTHTHTKKKERQNCCLAVFARGKLS